MPKSGKLPLALGYFVKSYLPIARNKFWHLGIDCLCLGIDPQFAKTFELLFLSSEIQEFVPGPDR